MKSLLSTADELFDIYHLERIPRVDYISSYPKEPSMVLLTEQEKKWIEEDKEKDK